MGEQFLHRLGISFDELVQRLVILLDQFVYIIYGSHLEITSIVATSSFAKVTRHSLPAVGA
jgi:hypothetical protein